MVTQFRWLVVAAGALATASCGLPPPPDASSMDRQTAPRPTALTVAVDAATIQVLKRQVQANGTVQPWQEVAVSAEASSGIIESVLVTEGEIVAKGQVLARIEGAEVEAQIAEQEALVKSRQASLAAAEDENSRAQSLLASSAISVEQAEQAETSLAIARSDLAQAEASLTRLRIQQRRNTITAPVDGLVVTVSPVIGQLSQAGTTLFNIVRDRRLEVAVEVPEFYLSALQADDEVQVVGLNGETTSGSVRSISPSVDPQTRLVEVYVSLPLDTTLRKGQFARATFTVKEPEALTVDANAVVWRLGEPGVFVIGSDGIATFVPAQLGTRANNRIAISGDLEPGALVAVAGAGFLNPGDKVATAPQGDVVTGALQ